MLNWNDAEVAELDHEAKSFRERVDWGLVVAVWVLVVSLVILIGPVRASMAGDLDEGSQVAFNQGDPPEEIYVHFAGDSVISKGDSVAGPLGDTLGMW